MSATESGSGVRCAACGEPLVAGDRFCEGCGAPVATDGSGVPERSADARPCAECAAPPSEIAADGYCQRCGRKQPDPRDHLEEVAGAIAGVTDKGVSHWRNEDAMAFSTAGDGFVIVVCDGVSSTQNPQQASQAAVDAALAILVAAAAATPGGAPDAIVQAAAAANRAAVAVPYDPDAKAGPPSCTFVAAVLVGETLTVGWVGDSRAYWLDEAGGRQLTRDDSWATQQVAAGAMSETEAFADPRAHAITRWLGADAEEVTPQVVEAVVDAPGLVLVCSDGLWNYAATVGELVAVVGDIDVASEDPAALTRRLCAFAIAAGGHDNITVVAAPVRPGER